jgi:hypothetical protein
MLEFPEKDLVGFVGNESGMVVSFRNNGEELLFASRENSPLRWVKVIEFTPDPKAVLTADDLSTDEEEDD